MRVANATVFVLALVSSAALAASDTFPPLSQPDRSNPAVAAFVAWHTALVKGDFAGYQRLTPAMPNVNDDLLRQLFDQLRLTAPKTVQVTVPKTNVKGGVEFQTVGCIGARPVVSVVAVGNRSGTWMVGGSAWGPSWNPKISDFVKCP